MRTSPLLSETGHQPSGSWQSAWHAGPTPREEKIAKNLEAQIRRRPPQQSRTGAGRQSSHAVSSQIQSITLKFVFEAGTP
jgi:hypothetical protein